MTRKINRIGLQFGRLLVIEWLPGHKYLCRCECGVEKEIDTHRLTPGKTRSCGCLRKESVSKQFSTHGESKTAEYRAWTLIKNRTCNPNGMDYKDYMGRGITICEEWKYDFPAFLAYVGKRPSNKHSIDRIDVNKGYEPGNTRWATARGASVQ